MRARLSGMAFGHPRLSPSRFNGVTTRSCRTTRIPALVRHPTLAAACRLQGCASIGMTDCLTKNFSEFIATSSRRGETGPCAQRDG